MPKSTAYLSGDGALNIADHWDYTSFNSSHSCVAEFCCTHARLAGAVVTGFSFVSVC